MKTTAAAPRKTDWATLKARFEAAFRKALPESSHPEQAGILRERARLAALPLAAPQSTEDHMDLIEFMLAHEHYAIEQSLVAQVIRLESYVPLPGAPSFVLGVTPWRGKALTIIDLKTFFELPSQGITDLNKVIVLESGTQEFGLLADSVSGALRRIPISALQTLPANLSGVRAQFTRGVLADRRLILDGERLLTDPQFHPISK